jgi:hypothetical protein
MEYNDEHKMIFAWDGDSKEYAVEDAGDPHPATGYWLSSQYFGLKSIHADQSPSDETNSGRVVAVIQPGKEEIRTGTERVRCGVF